MMRERVAKGRGCGGGMSCPHQERKPGDAGRGQELEILPSVSYKAFNAGSVKRGQTKAAGEKHGLFHPDECPRSRTVEKPPVPSPGKAGIQG